MTDDYTRNEVAIAVEDKVEHLTGRLRILRTPDGDRLQQEYHSGRAQWWEDVEIVTTDSGFSAGGDSSQETRTAGIVSEGESISGSVQVIYDYPEFGFMGADIGSGSLGTLHREKQSPDDYPMVRLNEKTGDLETWWLNWSAASD